MHVETHAKISLAADLNAVRYGLLKLAKVAEPLE